MVGGGFGPVSCMLLIIALLCLLKLLKKKEIDQFYSNN